MHSLVGQHEHGSITCSGKDAFRQPAHIAGPGTWIGLLHAGYQHLADVIYVHPCGEGGPKAALLTGRGLSLHQIPSVLSVIKHAAHASTATYDKSLGQTDVDPQPFAEPSSTLQQAGAAAG